MATRRSNFCPCQLFSQCDPKVPVRPHDIAMHVASIYDVENEHDYIMDKALQAYSQHRRNEIEDDWTEGGGGGGETSPRHNRARHNHIHNHSHPQRPPRRVLSSSSGSNDGTLSSTSSSSSSSSSQLKNAWLEERKRRGFRLALCTLKDALGNEPDPVPHTYSSPGPGFLPLQRPWSASPSGRLDAIREVSLANNVVAESRKTTRPVHQHRLPTRSLPLQAKMDPPISRSTAYHIRNRTTHSWSEDAATPTIDPMTMSCPNARSLEEHMRSARAYVPRDPNPSPVIVKGRTIAQSPSSPQPPRDRPSSAYSYDGGLFLSASSCNKDYFVIHPDWVSEAMTVQKLSLTERQGRAPARTFGPASGRWAFGGEGRGGGGERGEEDEVGGSRRARRCRSAPPAKYRNPITWSS